MNQHQAERPDHAPLVVGEGAPDVLLADHDGRDVSLAMLWNSQPRVLLFVRHFG